ncbi:MAG TPA: DUF1697 domain-containing protein [Chloroflexota bacterium]|nr:DUF1697 domain-containing protein [Chloroflexota bacterium]
MSPTYIALLRGINVGGKNKLPMSELVQLFVEEGCSNVRSYIQSGNVVFSMDPTLVEPLSSRVTAAIAERYGYEVPILLRTTEQIGDVIRDNPFLQVGAAEDTLHVLFLSDTPEARHVDELDTDRSKPDSFVVRGREVYLYLPNGAGRTKLTSDYFERRLSTASTGRNWRTVVTLFELMKGG